MVLDSGMEVYIWIGKDSTEDEQKAGFKMAQVLMTSFLQIPVDFFNL